MINDGVFLITILLLIITIIGITVYFIKNRNSTENAFSVYQEDMDLKLSESERHARAIQLATNIYKGEVNEIIGSFILLDEYDHLSIIGSVSKAASFDLIGLKEDRIDFIEIKSPTAKLSTTENKVKKIIEKGNVFYRIIESGIPSQFIIKDREPSKKSVKS